MSDIDFKEMNKGIISEFRANHGKVGGMFEGAPIVLLTTKGRRSGNAHTTPLMYLPDGDRILVFASKGGAPKHPAWYLNLEDDPAVTVEVGDESYPGTARVLPEPDRTEKYRAQVERFPQFGEYEKRTSRVIPVVALERA